MEPARSTPSPYTPGYNQVPSVLAGRDDVLAAADEAIERAALDRQVPPALVLVGPRGMGKSVLLTYVASRAEPYGWPRLTVDTPGPGQLGPELARQARKLRGILAQEPARKGYRVTEAVMRANLPGVGAEVHLSRQAQQEQPGLPLSIEDVLAPLVALAAEGETGIVLTVDEAQDAAAEELRALATFHQRAVEADWPVVLLVAGLPPLRTGGLKSSFERADWFDIGPLSPPATLVALAEPAVRAGRPYEAGAAEHLAAHTGGYPYAVQLYGHAAWRRSQGQPVISAGAVDLAVPSAGAQLERNLYSQRWQRTPPRERQYLVALAETIAAGGDPTGAAVAERLGVTAKDLSMIRERLIDKGTLVAAGRALSFVVPGLAAYVLRQEREPATIGDLLTVSFPGPVITPTVPAEAGPRQVLDTPGPGQVPRDFDGDLDR